MPIVDPKQGTMSRSVQKRLAVQRTIMPSDDLIRIKAAVKAERERCARAICGPCAEGWEVRCGVSPGLPDLWYHPTQRDRGGQVCQASLMHVREEDDDATE